MDLKNVLVLPYIASTYSVTRVPASGTTSLSGSLANTHDGSDSTYYRYYTQHGGDGSITSTFYTEYTWTYPVTIRRVRGVFQTGTYGGNYKNGDMSWNVQLKIGGVWTTVSSTSFHSGAEGSNTWAYFSRTLDTLGTWANVTGCRGYSWGTAYSYEGDRQQLLDQYIYEIGAYREKNVEILKVKTPTTIIGLGRNDLSAGDKVRIMKNGTVYGLPLVQTGDPSASPVRVYDGSVVKAIAQADA